MAARPAPTRPARTRPAGRAAVHAVTEPRSGEVVSIPAGSRLSVSFKRRGLTTEWHVEDLPGHLLPLAAGGHEFAFLVFGAPEPSRLRLVRSGPGCDVPAEVRELTVLTSVG